MVTHYDVLGVSATATPAEVRRAYYDKARQLHPDGLAGQPATDVAAARRAMQDVNEAWRVLRDAGSRADYDRALLAMSVVSRADEEPAAMPQDDEWMDRPYPRRTAEPGDVSVAIVRVVPWLAIMVLLAIIFVFTAYARRDAGRADLVGRCVRIDGASASEVPCDGPNEGRVVALVDNANLCSNGTSAHAVGTGRWFCLRPTAGR